MNISKRLSAIVNRIIVMVLAFLGFSSCHSEDEPDNVLCMYGTPTGSFEIKGEVTDESGKGVVDAIIKVTQPNINSDVDPIYLFAKDTTDMAGKYDASGVGYSSPDLKVVCVPQRDDLESDSTIVTLTYKKDKNDKNFWYRGHAEATANFKLKKKQK